MKILYTAFLLFAFNAFGQTFSISPNFQANILASTGTKAINSMIQLANKSWVIGGSFNNYNGNTVSNCVLTDANGTFIRSFVVNGAVNKVDTSKTGDIIIAGAFTTYNSNFYGRIIKIDSLGNIAANWVNTGIGNTINDVKVLPNDSMIIVGNFVVVDTCSRVARLTPNGMIDTSYHTYPGVPYSASTYVFKVALQSDGKAVIVGYFSQYNTTNTNCIARLNLDGSYDSTFNIGTGSLISGTPTAINSIAQLGDTLLVGGNFTSFNGILVGRLVKLYPDGTVDPLFAANIGTTGFSSSVSAIYPVIDGQVIVGGAFTSYKGLAYRRLLLLKQDGSVDNNFVNTGTANGINPTGVSVSNIYVDALNNVFVCLNTAGGAPTFNNVACNFAIALSNGLGTLPVKLLQFNASQKSNEVELNWQTVSEINNLGFVIERSSDGKDFEQLNFITGYGTTNLLHNYTYADNLTVNRKQQTANTLYYRLKQLDANGNFSYSNSVEVNLLLSNNTEISIAPNPFYNFITFSQICDVEIMNEKGCLLLHQKEVQYIETSSLPAGVYIVKTTTPQAVKHNKLVKY